MKRPNNSIASETHWMNQLLCSMGMDFFFLFGALSRRIKSSPYISLFFISRVRRVRALALESPARDFLFYSPCLCIEYVNTDVNTETNRRTTTLTQKYQIQWKYRGTPSEYIVTYIVFMLCVCMPNDTYVGTCCILWYTIRDRPIIFAWWV